MQYSWRERPCATTCTAHYVVKLVIHYLSGTYLAFRRHLQETTQAKCKSRTQLDFSKQSWQVCNSVLVLSLHKPHTLIQNPKNTSVTSYSFFIHKPPSLPLHQSMTTVGLEQPRGHNNTTSVFSKFGRLRMFSSKALQDASRVE
jgi:hypothetical protein